MPKQIPAGIAEAIIYAVQKRDCLYDTRSPAYRNRSKVELAWKGVADEVQRDVSYCKSIWASLRATFNRNLAKTNKNWPKWAFYQQMFFLKDYVWRGQMTESENRHSHSQSSIQTKLEYDSTGGAEESVDSTQSIEADGMHNLKSHLVEDEEDVTDQMRMEPENVPQSSSLFVAAAPPGPVPTSVSPARSTVSASPVSSLTVTDNGRKRKPRDPVEQEILQFVQRKARILNVARANEEESLAAFGHLLPFYRELPPLKRIQFLHHMSGYLMELYAECFPQ